MDSNDKGFCVFVVDDDPVIQTLFQSILAKDFAVEIFSSSEDCLQRLEEASPEGRVSTAMLCVGSSVTTRRRTMCR